MPSQPRERRQRRKRPRKHLEDDHQIALMRWAVCAKGEWPELDLLHHIPNGGKRSPREAARFRRMGVKPGIPDLFLPAARPPYHGLYIELKAPDGRATQLQRDTLAKLAARGYAAVVCFGWSEARRTIITYLKGNYATS